MKKYIICSLLCISMCFAMTGCKKQTNLEAEEQKFANELEEAEMEEEQPIEEEVVEEIIQDGLEEIKREYHFVLPDGWEVCENKQSMQSALEIQGMTDDQYAVVIVLDKDILKDVDTQAYLQRYVEEASSTYEKPEIGEPERFETNLGTAYKMLIQGKIEGKVYANLIYVVDTSEYWYVTTACSYVSKLIDLDKDMDEFVGSFYKVEESIVEPVEE